MMTSNHPFLQRTVVVFLLLLLLISGLVTSFPSQNNDEEESMERILQFLPNATSIPINDTLMTPSPITEGVQEELFDAIELWNSMNVISYELGFSQSCMICMLSYISIVEDGMIVSVLNSEDRTPVDPNDEFYGMVFSVEILFEEIQGAIDDNAYEIRVTYDPTFGYPTSVYIDYELMMADEELGVGINSFVVLSQGNSTSGGGSGSESPTTAPEMDDGVDATAAPTAVQISPTASPQSPTDSSSSLSRFNIGNGVAARTTLFVMGLTGILSFY